MPQSWRESKTYNPEERRPSMLLEVHVTYNLFMSISTHRLTRLVEGLHAVQGGFRAGRSCADKITYLGG